MNRVICIKGHFYDGDKYSSCPHCAEGAAPIEPDHFAVVHGAEKEEKEEKKEKKGFFHKKEKKVPEPVPVVENKTAMYSEKEAEEIVSGKVSSREISERHSMQQNLPAEEDSEVNEKPEIKQEPEREAVPVVKPEPKPVPQPSVLSSAFSKVSEPPKTAPSDDGKTIGFFSTGHATEPPVGYLMCIAGEDFGTGFPLKSGNNTIGRSQSMDVVVMDTKVSREKQAYIMYEPYKREFYIKPGESSGLCYFNEEVVLAPMKMKAYDVIMLGDTKLMLFPICSAQFSWDDYTKQD